VPPKPAVTGGDGFRVDTYIFPLKITQKLLLAEPYKKSKQNFDIIYNFMYLFNQTSL
jgi:hypothetical protein